MRKARIRKMSFKLKPRDIVMLIILLIVVVTATIFLKFNNTVTPKILEVANMRINNMTSLIVHKSFDKEILKSNLVSNIIIVSTNKEGNIVGADFNMENIYELAKLVSDKFNENFNYAETGQLDKIGYYDADQIKGDEGYILALPVGIASKNVFIANLGPKIPVRIKFLGTVLTEVKTKVTAYGINNALIEVYLDIQIDHEIITPVAFEVRSFPYTILLSSKVIYGTVPSFLSSGYTTKTGTINIPIN